MILVTRDPGVGQRFLGTGWCRLGLHEVVFDLIHDPLLLGGEPHLVRGETNLVPLGVEGAFRLQRGQEVGEHALVGAPRAPA